MKLSMHAGCLAIAAAFIAGGALAQAPKYTKEQEKAAQDLVQVGCSADVLKAFSGKPDKEEKNAEAGDAVIERSYGENIVAIAEKDQKVLATVVRDAKAPEAFKKYLGIDRAALEKQYGLPHVEFNLLSAVSYGGDDGEVRMTLENGKVQEVAWNCGGGEEGEGEEPAAGGKKTQ